MTLVLTSSLTCYASGESEMFHAPEDADAWPIVVVADLQRTFFFERVIQRRENNTHVQKRLFHSLQAVDPGLTIIVGDLVYNPRSKRDWQRFHSLTNGLTILPVMGNHDYPCLFGNERWCRKILLPALTKRFPHLEDKHGNPRTAYTHMVGDLGLVFLDSDSKQSLDEQLEGTLAEVDEARAILIFVHRPPYTNAEGAGMGPNAEVERVVAQEARKNPHIVAVFSGHAHGYERFRCQNTTFVVTGGGGGPRRTYAQSDGDLYEGPICTDDGKRPFNYVVFRRKSDELVAETWGLCKSWTKIANIDSFLIKLPPPGSPVSGESSSTGSGTVCKNETQGLQ